MLLFVIRQPDSGVCWLIASVAFTVAFLNVRRGVLVDLPICIQDLVECLAAVFAILSQQILWPDLVGCESLGEFHQLPEVGLRFPGGIYHLVPELGPPLGVAVGAFFFHPHRRRQDQVRRLCGNRWICIGDHDEIFGIAVAGQGFLVEIGSRLDTLLLTCTQ